MLLATYFSMMKKCLLPHRRVWDQPSGDSLRPEECMSNKPGYSSWSAGLSRPLLYLGTFG